MNLLHMRILRASAHPREHKSPVLDSSQFHASPDFVALRAEIESLKTCNGIHPIVYADYHRLLSRIFPYGVFYTFAEEEVVVWAVIDLRRDTEWIRKRLIQ